MIDFVKQYAISKELWLTSNYTVMFIAIEDNMDMSCHYRLNLIKIETTVLLLNISTFPF